MNLIEQLGGYEKAKEWHDENTDKEWVGIYHMPKLYLALLEHRRQHNIFEVGDLIVLLHTNYRSDVFALTKSFKEIYDEKGMVYRHATDLEIQAGRRL